MSPAVLYIFIVLIGTLNIRQKSFDWLIKKFEGKVGYRANKSQRVF